jgi:hypothetical protein
MVTQQMPHEENFEQVLSAAQSLMAALVHVELSPIAPWASRHCPHAAFGAPPSAQALAMQSLAQAALAVQPHSLIW